MALPSVCSDADEVLCCVSWVTIAQNLLDIAGAALAECFPQDDCAGIAQYITMGTANDGVGDALTVDFTGAVRTFDSNKIIARTRLTFAVRLRESGWPMAQAENGVIVAPDIATQRVATRHALSHAEKLWASISVASRNGAVVDGTGIPGCPAVTLGLMTPLTPSGGVVGFVLPVTVDLPY